MGHSADATNRLKSNKALRNKYRKTYFNQSVNLKKEFKFKRVVIIIDGFSDCYYFLGT